MVMLLSCPAKKVTKECGIGEALRLGAPARRAALPYVPHPAALGFCTASYRFRLASLHRTSQHGKNRNIFVVPGL